MTNCRLFGADYLGCRFNYTARSPADFLGRASWLGPETSDNRPQNDSVTARPATKFQL